jgi:hypothetical protein
MVRDIVKAGVAMYLRSLCGGACKFGVCDVIDIDVVGTGSSWYDFTYDRTRAAMVSPGIVIAGQFWSELRLTD